MSAMIKRIMSIGSRSAPPDEKAKAWILILLLIIPALAGYFAIYQKLSHWFTPRNEGFFELTPSGIFAVDTVTICLSIASLGLFISAAYARANYRFATVLKEAEKGYYEPKTGYHEPIEDEEDMYDFTVGLGDASATTYAPISLKESQIINALESIPLTPNQLRLYEREYKQSRKITAYLSEIRPSINARAIRELGRVQQGDSVYLPV